jgi:tetratricopeptide (TPR) repeat protein/2-polyprenyl-3-methyl-5-hydroxy-6-metoxy-1,4-benzoquinol methylase
MADTVRLALENALRLHQGGKLVEAERAYLELLAIAPDDPDVLFQLGVLIGERGRLGESETYLTRAAALRPQTAAYRNALGMLYARQRRFSDALASFDEALGFDPTYVFAWICRAEAMRELGNLEAAEESYRSASDLAPDAGNVQFGWATVLAELGRLEEAERLYEKFLASQPHSVGGHFNLATVLRSMGRLEDAARHYEAVLAVKPDFAEARVGLALLLKRLNRPAEALAQASEAMRLDPDLGGARPAFVSIANTRAPSAYNAEFCSRLIQCLAADDIKHEDLGRVTAMQLVLKYGLDAAVETSAAVKKALRDDGATEIFVDELLLLLLRRTIICELRLEAFLTAARRFFLFAPELPSRFLPFLAALAIQGFNNAYAFAIEQDEEAYVESIGKQLIVEFNRLSAPTPICQEDILRYALYAPLTKLESVGALLRVPKESWSAPLQPVVEITLRNPAEESEIAHEISTLGPIVNVTSRAVQAQYEENPYPRWLSMRRHVRTSFAAAMRWKFPRLVLPDFIAQPLEILVAGCGTGQEPIQLALSLTNVRILAIDLSRASLAYARRKASELGADNIEFLQADILELGRLGRQFPVIISGGVLHHMEDPMAGCRQLTALLCPGGFIFLAFYSKIARTEVKAARLRIMELGLQPVSRDIRAFRRSVLFGEEASRFPGLAKGSDMYDLNGCRDLLFHAREHCFTLREIGSMIAQLGLEFIGFELANDDTARQYRAANPEDSAMIDLERWASFEEANPKIFSGMYNFWCRKPD